MLKRVSAGGSSTGEHPKEVLKSVGWLRGTELRLTPLTKKKMIVEVDE